MASELWCKVCNQAVNTTVSRGMAAAAIPLAGMLGAAIPRAFGRRRRSGLVMTVLQGTLGAGAAYLASKYVVPQLQDVVCGSCGGKATARAAA